MSCVKCHKDRSPDWYCSCYIQRTYCGLSRSTICVHICILRRVTDIDSRRRLRCALRQHGPSTRLVETRARQHGPCWRVMETGHPSTRVVESELNTVTHFLLVVIRFQCFQQKFEESNTNALNCLCPGCEQLQTKSEICTTITLV